MPYPFRYRTVAAAVSCLLGVYSHSAGAQQGPINAPELTTERLKATLDSLGALMRVRRAGLVALDTLPVLVRGDSLVARQSAFISGSPSPVVTECLAYWAASDPNIYSFGCPWRVRASSAREANAFFGELRVGDAVALTFGEQSALYTELLADNLWIAAPVGFVRVGVSAQVSGARDEDPVDESGTTVEQFFQGGGNGVLYFALPIGTYLNFIDRSAPKLIRRVDGFATLAFGADVPKMSGPATDPAGNVRLGFNLIGFQSAQADVFRFFAELNGHVVGGFSPAFYRNLNPALNGGGVFLAGTASVGVDLAKLVRVGIRTGGATLIDGVGHKPQLTFQLLPKRD